MAKKKGVKIPGLSFSWKKAKATGIPTTKSGRRAKVGKMLGIF